MLGSPPAVVPAVVPALVGQRSAVPLVGGRSVAALNLDIAASAPALAAVDAAVQELLPWYSSVHRGAGYASQVSTLAYEAARSVVGAFVGARSDDVVLFTRNTTDSLNLLAAALPPQTHVVAFAGEHHANLLPWRRHVTTHLDVPASPEAMLGALDAALHRIDAPAVLVAVTGACNVTGERWPIPQVVEVARRHGARVVVDAAQLAPHAPIDVAGWGVDYVAFSGHKLYAPYGAGVLIGRTDWLAEATPYLAGGGAVRFVTLEDVAWTGLPDRHEAGSPNVIGAVAMAAACTALSSLGMDRVAEEEAALEAYATRRLAAIPGLTRYRTWHAAHPRIGVATFNLAGLHHSVVAAALSAEHGIAVRDGCFCAHPLMLSLLSVGEEEAAAVRADLVAGRIERVPGAVRASTGLGTTTEDIDRLADALTALATDGPRWQYRMDHGVAVPDPDDRPMPTLAFMQWPKEHSRPSGEAS